MKRGWGFKPLTVHAALSATDFKEEINYRVGHVRK